MSDQPTDTRSRIGARIDTDKKDALVKWAHSRTTPYQRVTISQIVREAVTEHLEQNYEQLPEEAKDDLDDDLKANAGGESA